MSNDVKFRGTFDDQVSTKLKGVADTFDRIGGKGSGASLFGNVGAKAVAFGFGLIEGAAQSALGALEGIVEAGVRGEESTNHLTTALKANVVGWDGTTVAIDDAIKSNEQYGFTADETRDSLASLVAATHDVNKALDVQKVAMDLARFKHISLGDATQALTKVEAGSYRILKSLGIQLAHNATQQDALNAVERVAAGQAEDYANTTGGKLLAAQTKWNDAIERAGEKLLPLVADGLNFLNQVIDDFTTSTGVGTDTMNTASVAVLRYGGAVRTAAADTGHANDAISVYAGNTGRSEAVIDANMQAMANVAHTSFGSIAKNAQDLTNALLKQKDTLVSDYFTVLIDKDNLLATNSDIVKQKRIIASKTATAQEKRDAKAALDQDRQNQYQTLKDLVANGGAQSKIFTTSLAGLEKDLKTAHGADKVAIANEIAELKLLAAQAIKTAKYVAQDYGPSVKGNAPKARASGGPVSAGNTYTVGEEGPETLVMGGSGGYVIPGGASRRGVAGVMIEGVSQAQIMDMVERGLFFRLRRAGTGRV